MNKITYVVEGRVTADCWMDEDDERIAQGPAELLSASEDFGTILPALTRYFKRIGPTALDLTHFVTVTEKSPKGKILGSRIFTVYDTDAERHRGIGSATVARVAAILLENGMRQGSASNS